jgi:3,4-dihydroxy 2-butanone 4-phosphate synthase/GTP cyclohydrolase II
MQLATAEEAIADFRAGKVLIIVDDQGRENEGDLAVGAQFATPQVINFMAREACGLICIAMAGAMLDRLGIPPMVPDGRNTSGFGTNFTVSVEARHGVTTGISAYDRARTIQVLVNPASTPADIALPGHVFPLRARDGGVLERRGQTEASVDLARLAGLIPAAVICEVMAEDGTMARLPALLKFAAAHGLRIISVEALATYRLGQAGAEWVSLIDSSTLPTPYGRFRVAAYRDRENREHLLLWMGDLSGAPALVRLHSECLTGDVLGSLRCDCGDQLHAALQCIGQDGRGTLVYLRQEGRGIGLGNKIRAYALQDRGLDTVEANECLGFPADARSYLVAAAMLRDQGITAVRLMTNNPQKIVELEENGIHVVERVPLLAEMRTENQHYLRTKARKLGHVLPEVAA